MSKSASLKLNTNQTLYSGAYTIQEALKVADLNSQGICTLELPLGDLQTIIKKGDMIIFEGKKYRIVGYNQNRVIQPDGGYYDSITLYLLEF